MKLFLIFSSLQMNLFCLSLLFLKSAKRKNQRKLHKKDSLKTFLDIAINELDLPKLSDPESRNGTLGTGT